MCFTIKRYVEIQWQWWHCISINGTPMAWPKPCLQRSRTTVLIQRHCLTRIFVTILKRKRNHFHLCPRKLYLLILVSVLQPGLQMKHFKDPIKCWQPVSSFRTLFKSLGCLPQTGEVLFREEGAHEPGNFWAIPLLLPQHHWGVRQDTCLPCPLSAHL